MIGRADWRCSPGFGGLPSWLPMAVVFVLLGALIAVAGCGRGSGDAGREERDEVRPEGAAAGLKNLILITVDTLRPDHLGCYGYRRETSPNIDRFARGSMVFEQCLAHAPLTSTSCASLLSGLLPHETGVLGTVRVPSDLETVAETLEAAGFTTLAVVGNPVLSGSFGWAQGFAVFDSRMKKRDKVRGHRERGAEETTSRAIELLTEHTGDRLFLWVHYQDPHGPYTPPAEFAGIFESAGPGGPVLTFNRTVSGWGGIPSYQRLGDHDEYQYYVDRYDEEIRYMDHCFGRLLGTVAELGLSDSSVTVFTADHGEGMGENDYFFAHGENLHHSLLRVPLIIRLGRGRGERRADVVQHIDLVPTVLGALGVASDLQFRGADLRAEPRMDREILSEKEKGGTMRSLVFGGFKLVYSQREDRFELFHLATDPGEHRNLAGRPEHRERLEDLKTRMLRLARADSLEDLSDRAAELTAEETEELQALGYVY